jgi:hypothetical protein
MNERRETGDEAFGKVMENSFRKYGLVRFANDDVGSQLWQGAILSGT